MTETIVRLARDYPSVWSRPVISAIDTRIFRLRYFQRCLACGFCKDQCCRHGVDIDTENAERLLALGDDFRSYVGVPASEWFSVQAIDDEEFPSGVHVRTRTREGYCVFHDSGGRGCKIHAWCLRNGVDYHGLKPMVSALFPLTFETAVLMPSNEVLEGTLVCAGEGSSLYDGVRDELIWFFGHELARELDTLQADLR
jgi:hypothetical protein